MPTPTVVAPAPPATAPRRRITAWHHSIRRIYLFVVVFLGGNVFAGAIQTFATNGGLPTLDQLQQIYFVQVVERYPLIFGPVAALLLVALIAGPFYDRRLSREEAAAAERQHRAIASEEATRVAHPIAQKAAAEAVAPVVADVADIKRRMADRAAPEESPVQGPPFDEAQLPRAQPFIGRVADLAWLAQHAQPGRAVAVRGIGGLGKSSLLNAFASQHHADFPDGIAVALCYDRRSEDAALTTLRDVLGRFDPRRRSPTGQTWAALADAALTLSGKRALVILDNVEPEWHPYLAALVGPLCAAGLAVVLTVRQEVPRDVVAPDDTLVLGALAPDEALQLFQAVFARFPADQTTAAERIVRALGYHTLAVRQVAARAADTRAGDLPALAAELEANPRLAFAITSDNPRRDLEPVFRSSFDALAPDAGARSLPPAEWVPAQRLFAALAAFATPNVGRQAALALAAGLDIDAPTADDALALLKRRALLEIDADPRLPEDADRTRLRIFPLMRTFAEERLDETPATDQDAAHRAIAAFYSDYTNATPDPTLTIDEANITAVLEWAHTHDADASVIGICLGMGSYWRDRSLVDIALRALPWGVAVARRVVAASNADADKAQLANLVGYLGQIQRGTGNLPAAETAFQESLTLFRALNRRRNEGVVLSSLGQVARAREQLDDAESYFQRALVIAREVQDRQGEGVVLRSLGQVAQAIGQLGGAEGYFQQSLAIFHEVQDRQSEGVVRSSLGQIAYAQGQLAEAERFFQQALDIAREVQDRQGEGINLAELGLIAEQREQFEQAEQYYRKGLTVQQEVQDAMNTASIAAALGELLITKRDQRVEGCALLQEAALLYDEMGVPGGDDVRALIQQYRCGA